MILDNHYAVVFRAVFPGCEHLAPRQQTKQILTKNAFDELKQLSKSGHFVILEAWDITKGKCVSN